MNRLDIRDPENYPENLKYTLDLLTINEIPKVVGSTAYSVHKYPSDVDVFESVTVNMNRENALRFYASQLRTIAQKIKLDEKLFFTDFKAGEDPRYVLRNEDNTQNRLEFALQLYGDKLLDDKDTRELIKLNNDPIQYKMMLRKYRVLRWSLDEIINGVKEVPGKMGITLEKAISQNALIKIDVITWLISRYVSIEVFYDFRYVDPINNTIVVFHQLDSYTESLIKEIERYSMPRFNNPLKVSKRLWSLSRISDCSDLMQKINPLLGSAPAALNQVSSDIETIEILLKNKAENKYTVRDYDRMFIQILGFQKRIANHTQDMKFIDELIQEIYQIWKSWRESHQDKLDVFIQDCYIYSIIYKLGVIDGVLTTIIADMSQDFLTNLRNMNITCSNPRFSIGQ